MSKNEFHLIPLVSFRDKVRFIRLRLPEMNNPAMDSTHYVVDAEFETESGDIIIHTVSQNRGNWTAKQAQDEADLWVAAYFRHVRQIAA